MSRLLSRTIVLVSVLLAAFAVVQPAYATTSGLPLGSFSGALNTAVASCYGIIATGGPVFYNSINSDIAYAYDGNGTVIGTHDYGSLSGSDNFTFTDVTFSIAPVIGPITIKEFLDGAQVYSLSAPAAMCAGPLFNDGRLNKNDAGQTFAVYCLTDGSVKVYTIDSKTSKGAVAFVATKADIATVPIKPATNTAIKSALGATLYRLTSGELQVNRLEPTGKMYSYIFGGC